MIMAGTLARSFEESVLDFIRHQVRADLVVASTTSTGWIESPLDGGVADALAALPGVARVERLRLAEDRYRGERISIDSLEANAFAPDRTGDFVFAAGDPTASWRPSAGPRAVSRNPARRGSARRSARLDVDAARRAARPGGRRRRRLRLAARQHRHGAPDVRALRTPCGEPLPRLAARRAPPPKARAAVAAGPTGALGLR
jgi:hypothetical protein